MTTNDNDTLELIAHNYIEITMFDPLSDNECMQLVASLERLGIDTAINSKGRILTFDAHLDDLEEITGELADMGLVEDIGLIKHVVSFEPQWTREDAWTTIQ